METPGQNPMPTLALIVGLALLAGCASGGPTPGCDADPSGCAADLDTEIEAPDVSVNGDTDDTHDVSVEEVACQPDCASSTCGDDGCGGICGTCDVELLCTKGTCQPPPAGFVWVAAGTFIMGSPASEPCRDQSETQREVTLTRAFLLQTTEVTQAQWQALMDNNPSQATGCDDCPVEQVSWWGALAYCNALSDAEGLTSCYSLGGCEGAAGDDLECGSYSPKTNGDAPLDCDGYRLPTETEWEYAARAGTVTTTHGGDLASGDCFSTSAVLDLIAWYAGNSDDMAHPVGEKAPNAWGLHDAIGNVAEWTWDQFATSPGQETIDPNNVPQIHGAKVYRGGRWDDMPRFCRAAYRTGAGASHRNAAVGFRPARTVP